MSFFPLLTGVNSWMMAVRLFEIQSFDIANYEKFHKIYYLYHLSCHIGFNMEFFWVAIFWFTWKWRACHRSSLPLCGGTIAIWKFCQ